jgi:hypothetical protein
MDTAGDRGKTRIIVHKTCATAEERDGSKAGTEVLIDWCAAYLASI